MKKTSDFLKKRKQDLIYVGLINVFFVVAYNLLFYPRFHSDLDILMQSAVYGITGRVSSYIVFNNILIGKILSSLATILPVVAWYTVLHYVLIFASLFIITYITVKRNPGSAGKIVSAIIVAFVGYECYVEPNYMKTAVLLSVCAAYLFYYAYETKAKKKVLGVIAIALLSSMISTSAFVISAIIGFGIVIAYCLKGKCNKNWKIIITTTIVSIICLVVATRLIDNTLYVLAERETSLEYRDSVEKLYGYGVPDYSEEMEMDNPQYAILVNGLFLSNDDSQLQLVEELSTVKQEFSWNTISRFFKEVPISLFKTGMLYYLIVLSAIIFMTKDKSKIVIGAIGVLVVEYLFFYIFNAWKYEWISFIIMIPISLLLLLKIKHVVIEDKETIVAYLIVLSVILYSNFSGGMVKSVRQDSLEDLMSKASSECVYAVDMIEYLKGYSVYSPYEQIKVPENVHFANGIYKLIGEFEEYTRPGDVSNWANNGWLYNPTGFPIESVLR